MERRPEGRPGSIGPLPPKDPLVLAKSAQLRFSSSPHRTRFAELRRGPHLRERRIGECAVPPPTLR